MARPITFLGFALITATLFLTAGWSDAVQQKEQPQPKKGTLPQNWKKLGLNEEQLKKVYEVRGTFATKVDNLKTQIKGLQKEENDELMKVLTEDQKILLKKILTDKIPDPKKDPKKEEKKTDKQSLLRNVDFNHFAALERRIEVMGRRDA